MKFMGHEMTERQKELNRGVWDALETNFQKNKMKWSPVARKLEVPVSSLNSQRTKSRSIDFGLMCSMLELLGFKINIVAPDLSKETGELVRALNKLMKPERNYNSIQILCTEDGLKVLEALSGLSKENLELMYELIVQFQKDKYKPESVIYPPEPDKPLF